MQRTLAAVVVLAALAPVAAGDHVSEAPLRCDGGYCRDGEHHLVDCSEGTCTSSQGGFPTIVNPHYDEDNPRLDPDERVLGVEIDGEARAYPIEVMRWFETVEDEVAGTPILATYCPLCAAGVVFDRRLDGGELTLYNSGEIWRNDLVLYEPDTRTRFSQVLGEAIKGARHGEALELLPATITTWSDWRAAHPDGLVLQHPLDEDGDPMADYESNPYASYAHTRDTPQGHREDAATDLHPKTSVVGIERDGEALAIPAPLVREEGPIETTVGHREVVAAWQGGVHVYETGGRDLATAGSDRLTDGNGTEWWIANGTSPDGEALARVPAANAFWFAWLDTHPDTQVLTGSDPPTQRPAEPTEPSSVPGPGLLVLLAALGLAARSRGED